MRPSNFPGCVNRRRAAVLMRLQKTDPGSTTIKTLVDRVIDTEIARMVRSKKSRSRESTPTLQGGSRV